MAHKNSTEAATLRDAVLRRMLATPKPDKGGKERGEPKPAAPSPTSSARSASTAAKSASKRAPKP